MSKNLSHNLTIYLIKSGFETSEKYLKPELTLNMNQILSNGNLVGQLFIKPSYPHPPRWARIFSNYMNTDELGLVSSTSAVFLVHTSDRLFAITFGTGRCLLTPECWEDRFGLKVALNSIGDKQVRSIDKTTFDLISKQSREQANHETTAIEFGLDIEQDLLRAVTGTPQNSALGKRMRGIDALNVVVNTSIETLPELLSNYLVKYDDDSYKAAFPWVDQMAEVTSSVLREKLDIVLFGRISSNDHRGVWMAIPEVIEWERVGGFKYGAGNRYPEYHDIDLEKYLEAMKNRDYISRKAFSRRIYCVDTEGVPFKDWQGYRCLSAELDHDENSYILNAGKWYCVSKDFVHGVNSAIEQLPMYTKEFPEYNDISEPAYNKRITDSNPEKYALMDSNLISYGGGHSTIEFCDLFTNDGDIIHVKRYGNSSVLSHLFAQGLISGELFQTDVEFRKKVNEKLPERYKLDDPTTRLDYQQYQVVFAVVSNRAGELVLPFFSRLNLKNAARKLVGYGYRVAKAKICVNTDRTITERLR